MTCAFAGEACAETCTCGCGRPMYHVASPFNAAERWPTGSCAVCLERRGGAYDAAIARCRAEEERARQQAAAPTADDAAAGRVAFRRQG